MPSDSTPAAPSAPYGHVEIAHQVRRLGRLLESIDTDKPDSEDVLEVRHLLYSLYAILGLHFEQEDERYYSLADDLPAAGVEQLVMRAMARQSGTEVLCPSDSVPACFRRRRRTS
jgi:hypothetical protein